MRNSTLLLIMIITIIALAVDPAIMPAALGEESGVDDDIGNDENSKDHEICTYMIVDRGIQVGWTVPSGIPYSTDRFNAYTQDDEIVGHAIIEKKVISSIDCSLIEDPTYNIYILDLQTIEDIYAAESRIDELNRKLDSGDIRVEGTSTMKSVMVAFTRLGLKVAGWFY